MVKMPASAIIESDEGVRGKSRIEAKYDRSFALEAHYNSDMFRPMYTLPRYKIHSLYSNCS